MKHFNLDHFYSGENAQKSTGDYNMLFRYMFLNLLSLYLHFQILNMIDWKYSVRDVFLILSRIKI